MSTTAPILCINCHQPAFERCTTEAGKREVAISHLCESCWEKALGPEPRAAFNDAEDAEDAENDNESSTKGEPHATA